MKIKRFLSLFLSLLLILSCVQTTVFAANNTDSTINVKTLSGVALAFHLRKSQISQMINRELGLECGSETR